MGYFVPETAPAKSDPAAKNRVRGFFGGSVSVSLRIRRAAAEPHRENYGVGRETASGIPYWPSRDPIEELGGLNLYGFSKNNGISMFDRLGLEAIPESAEIPSDSTKDCPCKVTNFWKRHDTWIEDGNGKIKKYVQFVFTVAEGSDPKKCCLVQFIKGKWFNPRYPNFYARVKMLGEDSLVNYKDWQIDTVDVNPVYEHSEFGPLEGQPTRSVEDNPGPIDKDTTINLDFKMCIFDCDDVPKDGKNVDVPKLMAKAIKCISWEAKGTHDQIQGILNKQKKK